MLCNDPELLQEIQTRGVLDSVTAECAGCSAGWFVTVVFANL